MNRMNTNRFDYYERQLSHAQTPLDLQDTVCRASRDPFIDREDYAILYRICARRLQFLLCDGEEVLA